MLFKVCLWWNIPTDAPSSKAPQSSVPEWWLFRPISLAPHLDPATSQGRLAQWTCFKHHSTQGHTVTSRPVSPSFPRGFKKGDTIQDRWVFKCLDLKRGDTWDGYARNITGNGIPIGTAIMKTGMQVLKLKLELPYDSATPLWVDIQRKWNHNLQEIPAPPCSLQN